MLSVYTPYPIKAGCLPVVLFSLRLHGSARGNIVSSDVNGVFVIGIIVYPEEEISEDVEYLLKSQTCSTVHRPGDQWMWLGFIEQSMTYATHSRTVGAGNRPMHGLTPFTKVAAISVTPMNIRLPSSSQDAGP